MIINASLSVDARIVDLFSIIHLNDTFQVLQLLANDDLVLAGSNM
jgi:hypothetical protein